jgi:hypothetical protein
MLTYVQLTRRRDYISVTSTRTTVAPDSMPAPAPGCGAIVARRGLRIGVQIADLPAISLSRVARPRP